MALLTQIKENSLPLKSLYIVSITISGLFILIGLVGQLILPPEIPLFYGLPKSAAQIAPSLAIVIPSSISLVITIINAIISIKIDGLYLKKALAIASISTCLLAMITTYKIMFLVGSI